MKTKWSALLAVIPLILSAGIAAGQGNAAPTSTDGRGRGGASRSVVTLTRVSVRSEEKGVSVEITCNRPVTPTPTMISDPSRLVLDFADTISASPKNRIDVNRDGLKSVRIGVQAVDPPQTRVVLDLEQSRAYRLVADGNKLTVKFGQKEEPSTPVGSDSATDKQTSSAAEPSSAPEDLAAEQSSPVPQASAAQASSSAGASEAAPNVKSSAAGQDADTSAEPKAAATQPGGAQEPAPSPPSQPSDPGKAAGTPISLAANPGTASEQSRESKPTAPADDPVAEAAVPAGNNNSASADRQKGTPQAKDDPKPASVSSGAQANSSPGTSDPAPHPGPAEQPPSLVEAKAAPDLPAATSALKPGTVRPTPTDYVIGEQDVLSIVVWKERELSAAVVVRPDGKITLPLINEIKVIGMTPAQLQAILTEKFKPFVNIPQVTVEVVQINSRKAYLIGEVQKTGTFPLNSSTTVLQIIAQAGGLRDFAKRKDIYILRNQQGKQVRYRFNYDEVIRGKNTQQNMVLQPGDMVVVP